MKVGGLVQVKGSKTGITYKIKKIAGGQALLVNDNKSFWDSLDHLRRVK